MNKLVILPYKMSSKSSRALSKHFGCKRVYPNRNYRPKNGDVVINWGFCGVAPILEVNRDFTILNKPFACDRASDKVSTLRLLKQYNVPHVEFFLNKDDAIKSCEEGNIIYCRTITRGREGQGIVLAKTPDEIVDSRLYTKYFKNDHEFRIHVFNGEVIDEVEKKKMTTERMAEMGIERGKNWEYIRNLKKSWSFCRKDIEIPEIVELTAINAVAALGLDFGGVDMAYDSESGECKVLEVNTACGMGTANGVDIGSTTHMRYVRAISQYLNIPFSLEEYNQKYNCNAEEYLR